MVHSAIQTESGHLLEQLVYLADPVLWDMLSFVVVLEYIILFKFRNALAYAIGLTEAWKL